MIVFKRDFPRAAFTVYDSKPKGLDFYQVNQVHGTRVVQVPTEIVAADGMYCQTLDQPSRLCVLTADCLPVFALGNKGYALVHAGWRGIASGILHAQEIKKINPNYFFIGPHIQSCCYQVHSDFINNFKKSESFFKRDEKTYFDLGLEAKKQLEEKFPRAKIEICKSCTCCGDIFHSYRRDKTEHRNWNVIEIKE